MERWFKSHAGLSSGMESDQIGLSGGIRSTLAAANDEFSHPCLSDKGLPLELLTTDEEGVPSIIELEVQLDGKCFGGPHEETAVLSNEETILFEEVRDTPSVLHQDEREPLPSVQSKVVVEERITLLTPHELESMRVMSAPESDSEKEEEENQPDASSSDAVGKTTKLKPLVVVHEEETLYVCPIEDCSKAFPKLLLAKSHIMSHTGVQQFKV